MQTEGDALLKKARIEALQRTIDRQKAVASDLDVHERTVLDTPNPVLARLEALETELVQREAVAMVLDQEERTQLLELESAAIRASVSELVTMVRGCEASFRGITGEIAAQEAAERELLQTLA